MRFLIRLLVNAAALWVATRLVTGVSYEGGTLPLLGVALVFGVVNALIRPATKLLTFTIIILTLGFFALVVNGLMVWLVTVFLRGIHIQDPWHAILTAIVISLTSWVASGLIGSAGLDRRR